MAACSSLGLEENKITVDYKAKTVSFDGDVTAEKLAAALEGTQYSIAD